MSPKYLTKMTSTKGSKPDPSGWREFLLHLGVQSAIAIERIDQSIDPASKVVLKASLYMHVHFKGQCNESRMNLQQLVTTKLCCVQ